MSIYGEASDSIASPPPGGSSFSAPAGGAKPGGECVEQTKAWCGVTASRGGLVLTGLLVIVYVHLFGPGGHGTKVINNILGDTGGNNGGGSSAAHYSYCDSNCVRVPGRGRRP